MPPDPVNIRAEFETQEYPTGCEMLCKPVECRELPTYLISKDPKKYPNAKRLLLPKICPGVRLFRGEADTASLLPLYIRLYTRMQLNLSCMII